MFCGKCGKKIEGTAKFCPYCGTPVDQKVVPVKKNTGKIIGAILVIAIIAVAALLWSQRKPESTYEDYLAEAEQYLSELKYDQAESVLKHAIKIEPERKEAYISLAYVYESDNKKEDAVNILETSLKKANLQEEDQKEIKRYIENIQNGVSMKADSDSPTKEKETVNPEQAESVLTDYLKNTLIPDEGKIEEVAETKEFEMSENISEDEQKKLLIGDGIVASFIEDMDGDGVKELHVFRNEAINEDSNYYNQIFWEVYVCEGNDVKKTASQEILQYQSLYANETYNIYLKKNNGYRYIYSEADGVSMDAKMERVQSVFSYTGDKIKIEKSLVTTGGNGGFVDIYDSDSVYLPYAKRWVNGEEEKNKDAKEYYVYGDGKNYSDFDSYAVSFCPHCGAPIKNDGKGEYNTKDKTYDMKDVNGNKNGHHRSPVGKWIVIIIAVVVIGAAAMLLNQRKTEHPQKGTETAESKESSETVQSTEAAETEQTKDVLMSYLQDTLIPEEGQISSVDEIRSYQVSGTSAADEDKTLVIPDGIAASFIKDMDGDGIEELHILRDEAKTENYNDYDYIYNCIFWEVYAYEDGKVSQVCSQEIIKYQATYAEEAYNVYLKDYNGKSYLYAEADGLSMDAKLERKQNIFVFADNNIYTVRSLFTCGGNGGYTDIYKSDAVYLDDVNRIAKGAVVKKAEAEPYYVYGDGQGFSSFDSYLDGYTEALNKELSEYGITMSSDGEKEYPFYGIYLADPSSLDTHIFNYQLEPESIDYIGMDETKYTVVIKGKHEGETQEDEVPAESDTAEKAEDMADDVLTNEMLDGIWIQKDASDAMQFIFSSDENSVRYYTTINNGSEYTTNYSLENGELKVDVVNLDGNDVTTLYFDLTYSEEENIKILTMTHSDKDNDIDTSALYGFDDLMDGTYVQVKEDWVKKQLNVPEDLDVNFVQGEAYYWDAAQIYVRYFEIIEDDDTVAFADFNALTGELAREISPYHH